MNWLDIVIIIFILISLGLGLLQGFVRMLLSLLGTVVGVIVAANFYSQFANLLKFIPNPNVADIVAFVIILLVISIIGFLIGSALKALLTALHLGCLDRILGGGLGFVMGILFIGAILAVFVMVFGTGPVTDSFLAGIILDKIPIVLGLLPSDFRVIRNFFP